MPDIRWTREHLADFARLRSEGWPWADIAKLYDATESAVTSAWYYRNVRREGPAAPPVSLPRPTMTEDEMLARINADGGFPVRIVLNGRTLDVRRAA